ncbi:peroxidase 2-like [Cryptomeria japonica]|uniref:peroxidase 2-like n=1 Tax=Cryptomeria japonica TaxID=3369 RepID=UPI0027DAAF84|nr:peroxidase 2-like [Cryptomeria japonica]
MSPLFGQKVEVFSLILVMLCLWDVNGQLSSTFYDKMCPQALSTVKAAVKVAVAKEKRMAASLLRLHFHDCFVNGCDGSILLDTTSGEKGAGPNANSVRGFEVIDTIKTQVEAVCSGVVSCADILAIAARDSVVELGGPTWTILLGRRDSTIASRDATNSNLPAPSSTLRELITNFTSKGLSTKDMVALSGAHTIGQARCTTFRDRIYNDRNIDKVFATSLEANCPNSSGKGDNNIAPIDTLSPTIFDNNYYKDLISKKGVFHSDQELFNGASTDSQVTTYSTNQNTFFNDFVTAMVKMGNIKPLIGTRGQVQKNCRKPN